ncbi:MAG: 50S ribosomal protein L23 [Parcubacteria group bacterium ADurb.Bin216]|nr:MAG: 50S ribosomal protein L23 [Parcubacteria group bacterium ADurb.Bin216]
MASEQNTKKEGKALNKMMGILRCPKITEKAAALAESNFYVFELEPTANKIEVKKAIKDYFNVDVEKVTIINLPRKKVQKGKVVGHKGGCKKAIVKVKEGQKIDIIEN